MANFDNPYSPPGKPDYSPSYHQGHATSPLAIASMILGIVGIVTVAPSCCCTPLAALTGLFGFVALILGYFGFQEVQTQGKKGKELAIAGMVCGGVCVALALMGIALFAVQTFLSVNARQFPPPNF